MQNFIWVFKFIQRGMGTFPLKLHNFSSWIHAFIFSAILLRFCMKVRLVINSRNIFKKSAHFQWTVTNFQGGLMPSFLEPFSEILHEGQISESYSKLMHLKKGILFKNNVVNPEFYSVYSRISNAIINSLSSYLLIQ